jgi:hypothetical protein
MAFMKAAAESRGNIRLSISTLARELDTLRSSTTLALAHRLDRPEYNGKQCVLDQNVEQQIPDSIGQNAEYKNHRQSEKSEIVMHITLGFQSLEDGWILSLFLSSLFARRDPNNKYPTRSPGLAGSNGSSREDTTVCE